MNISKERFLKVLDVGRGKGFIILLKMKRVG